ncbi:hydrogenase expression/formation protein [Rhodospirillum sp. A1_3_36]|uniref:hydrogenase expression/formation protein n=1 Tax=Rhodospirillum sp. A1_3_36 TaxID=3391666 RepID=UPI0039A77953
MLNNFTRPPIGFGAGSQPASGDGQELEYMPLPKDMRTFQAHLPEVEDPDALAPALALMEAIAEACATHSGQDKAFDLAGLDTANRALLDETLGRGEVSADLFDADQGKVTVQITESVFAGVWTVIGDGPDRVEVSPMPKVVGERAFRPSDAGLGSLTPVLPGVVNAPPLVTEMMDKSASWRPGSDVHVINLSLLPHTPEDLSHLDMALGSGSVAIASRGYGDCRIRATALANVWKVQFFNSMDAMILDTYEVTGVPEVAMAAREDLEDSAERLREVLESIR